jgi:N utilization substance protein B
MVCKTISGFKEEHGVKTKLLSVFKNEDDLVFTKTLLRKSILNGNEYKELLKKFTRNWELERIAFLDTLLIQLALTEIVEFPSIPIKVSMNEYIEIAKFYSTPKSNVFLNGVLDQIVQHLKKQNKINKMGRGLVGENADKG